MSGTLGIETGRRCPEGFSKGYHIRPRIGDLFVIQMKSISDAVSADLANGIARDCVHRVNETPSDTEDL